MRYGVALNRTVLDLVDLAARMRHEILDLQLVGHGKNIRFPLGNKRFQCLFCLRQIVLSNLNIFLVCLNDGSFLFGLFLIGFGIAAPFVLNFSRE